MIPSTLGFPREEVIESVYTCWPKPYLMATAWESIDGRRIGVRLRDVQGRMDWRASQIMRDMKTVVRHAIVTDWLLAVSVIKHWIDTYESNPLPPIEESTT